MKDVYQRDGIFGFWRGLYATWMRDVPFYMVFFGSYIYYKQFAVKTFYSNTKYTTDSLPAWNYIIGGGLAGSAAWFTIFPIDSLKSKQQASVEKISFAKTAKSVYAEGGIRLMYKGVWPCVIRGFPANAALFLVVEYTKVLFRYFGLDGGASLGSKT